MRAFQYGLSIKSARIQSPEVLLASLDIIGVAGLPALAVLITQCAILFRVLPIFGLGWGTAHQSQPPQRVHAIVVVWMLLLFRLAGLEQAVVVAVCVALLNLALAIPSFAPAPLLWFGGISYSLFLTHVPLGGRVVNLLSSWPLTPANQLFACLLALVISVLVAWCFCAFIERPTHLWGRLLLFTT